MKLDTFTVLYLSDEDRIGTLNPELPQCYKHDVQNKMNDVQTVIYQGEIGTFVLKDRTGLFEKMQQDLKKQIQLRNKAERTIRRIESELFNFKS
jgi:hypothetical protein